MYLRKSKQPRTEVSVVTHLQLAANVWDAGKRRLQVSIVWNCSYADDPAFVEGASRAQKKNLYGL